MVIDVAFMPDSPAAANMDLDRALLDAAAPALRCYTWQPPAITLGCSQDASILDLDACRREGIAVVKRFTGGAAVLHLNDLTYAFFWPAACEPAYRPIELRERFQAIFLAAFGDLGIQAAACRGAAWRMPESAICFHGRADSEIVIADRKVAGNAQRITRHGIFQHGSIMLDNTEARFCRLMGRRAVRGVMTGLREHNPAITPAALAERIVTHAGRVFEADVRWSKSGLPPGRNPVIRP